MAANVKYGTVSEPMPEKPSETAPRWVKRLAIVSGLLGFVLFVLTPFMPVNQTQSSFSWPQQSAEQYYGTVDFLRAAVDRGVDTPAVVAGHES